MSSATSLTTPGDKEIKFIPENKPPLTDEQLKIASKELQNISFTDKFPKIDNNFADPEIFSQKIGLFSFVPATGATPNEKGIYGFAKMRGNFTTEEEASVHAEKIIKNSDSTHTIFHAYVGRPFPVTLSEKYVAETSEIDIRKDATESISNAIKRKKNEDKKVAEDLRQREQELLDDTSNADPEKIEEDEYITMRVKKAQLSWTYLEHISKIKEIKSIIEKTTKEIEQIDTEKPMYKERYFQKYMDARKKAGLSVNSQALQESFVKYLIEDAELPGINMSDDFIEDIMDNYKKPIASYSTPLGP